VPQVQSFVPGLSSTVDDERESIRDDTEGQVRDSVWTHFSTPARPQRIGAILQENPMPRPRRSLSQSTIEAPINKESLEAGAVKIIIDRAEAGSKSQEESKGGRPTIEVPIPHYRLGTPRFSARGTAFLHSSVYTRSSVTDDLGSSVFSGEEGNRLFPGPPVPDPQLTISRRHSHTSPQPYTTSDNSSHRDLRGPADTSRLVYQMKAPIVPQIYDTLALKPDDPSVVKYSPTTGEIIAATPARIIAQITSESFLDYELLSDFFLTVRAYLSTQDLLFYLLARFEWAINRFDDHGRVIRVRAFAALRHWILNYFAYDFVMDRSLRVTFCDRLNALTRIVRARANYGASDMKLISDLKKCWNGRCILYWDNPTNGSDPLQDGDIYPGGIVGSRDSELTHPSQLFVGLEEPSSIPHIQTGLGEGMSGPDVAKWYNTTPGHAERTAAGHVRQASAATTRSLPTSPRSEQSIPVLSCSFTAKGHKRTAPYANRAIGIHPVPISPDGRRICPAAPSALANEKGGRPLTAHRRSGSFSDAARDKREPLSSDRTGGSENPVQLAFPYAGSLIRGAVVTPGDPSVSAFAPTTPAVEHQDLNLSSQSLGNGVYGNRKLGTPNNPGVKHLLGNIRRALSSKNSGNNQHSNYGGSSASGSTFPVGKNAPIPMNVMYDASSTGQAGSTGSISRVDILAAEIAEAYNQATMEQQEEVIQQYNTIGVAFGNELEQPSPDHHVFTQNHTVSDSDLARPKIRRLDSGVTNGSQSILIVDDTGLNISDLPPVPTILPGAAESNCLVTMDYRTLPPIPLNSVEPQSPPDIDQVDVSQVLADAGLSSELRHVHDPVRQASVSMKRQSSSERKIDMSRPSMVYRGQSFKSTKSGSVSLRRYASFQSTFTKHSPGNSFDLKTAENSIFNGGSDVPPVHILRRRPGGDLRANQNVHDLEEITRPRSTGSLTTYSDSMRGSELFTSERLTRTMTTRLSTQATQTSFAESTATEVLKSPSFVRTHSSQPALRRPSFEAAVAEFAAIPDDEEGGIEATLLKLEGRYQKTPIQSPVPPAMPENIESTERLSNEHAAPTLQGAERSENYYSHDHDSHDSIVTLSSLPHSEDTQRSTRTPLAQHEERNHPVIASTSYAESEESYNSVPLLDRGTDQVKGTLGVPVPQIRSYNGDLAPNDGDYDGNSMTISMRRLKHGSSAPTATTDSFLLDEDDDFLSDLSSELSLDFLDRNGTGEAWPQVAPPQQQKENTVLVGDHPPSPPMTMENALAISSQATQAQEQRKPPTPDPSPVHQHVDPTVSRHQFITPQALKQPSGLFIKSRHMPFILGYDSELLAQQFTIIEKDALSEIDWRDLVDMRWQNTAPSVTNWVEYLRSQDPQGIDIVTARFNLMVKWALSEIVLTQNIEERTLALVKCIHIAQQARKVHNYATMLQLTIALTSTDCTRLTKTWDLVPVAEKKILHDLEELVTPRRNFQNLRQEMEKANSEEGCIPFVGKSTLLSQCSFFR
jgi:hypothetical protein